MCIVCETLGTEDGLANSGVIELAEKLTIKHHELITYLCEESWLVDDSIARAGLCGFSLAIGVLLGQQEAGLSPYKDFLDGLDD